MKAKCSLVVPHSKAVSEAVPSQKAGPSHPKCNEPVNPSLGSNIEEVTPPTMIKVSKPPARDIAPAKHVKPRPTVVSSAFVVTSFLLTSWFPGPYLLRPHCFRRSTTSRATCHLPPASCLQFHLACLLYRLARCLHGKQPIRISPPSIEVPCLSGGPPM